MYRARDSRHGKQCSETSRTRSGQTLVIDIKWTNRVSLDTYKLFALLS